MEIIEWLLTAIWTSEFQSGSMGPFVLAEKEVEEKKCHKWGNISHRLTDEANN